MIRVLIVSDSHGHNEDVRAAVKKAGKIDFMFHLGDVEGDYREIESMAGVPTYIVAGNNDFGGELLDRNIIFIGNHKIYATHGHRQRVYYGTDMLKLVASQYDCDIAMFGHTHMPHIEVDGDIKVVNPGSISLPRQTGRKQTFIIMTIEDNDEVRFELEYL